MIPKKIHYCWFGSGEKSKVFYQCRDSWEKYLPEYELKEWNETNSPLEVQFVKDAIAAKKWAFVSDYIRLYALVNEGGIYFDTDMLVLKNLDNLLSFEAFMGFESKEFVAAGILGSKTNHPFFIELLDVYEKLKFNADNLIDTTIPRVITSSLQQRGLIGYGEQTIAEVKIFPISTFYPFTLNMKHAGFSFQTAIKDDTLAIHLWDESWMNYKEKALIDYWNGNITNSIINFLKYFLRNPFDLKAYKDFLFCIRSWMFKRS